MLVHRLGSLIGVYEAVGGCREVVAVVGPQGHTLALRNPLHQKTLLDGYFCREACCRRSKDLLAIPEGMTSLVCVRRHEAASRRLDDGDCMECGQ